MGLRTWIYEKTGIKLKKIKKKWVEVAPPEGYSFGFIGNDLNKNERAQNILVKRLSEAQKHAYLVVSFYTEDNEYAEIVKNLRATLEKFEIPHKLVPIKSQGAWELDCAMKAKFMQREWELSDVPIVWIDADATVESMPTLLPELDCDVAFHKWNGWELASGTLYFNKTELAKKLLDRWVERSEADPINWDQVSLQSAWCDISSIFPLKTIILPRAYCGIWDLPVIGPRVIKHWQASLKVKKEGRVTGQPQFKHTESGLDQRDKNILWRTPEETLELFKDDVDGKPRFEALSSEDEVMAFWLREIVKDHYPVVDVGCGIGAVARYFEPKEYIGIDMNPAVVVQARASLPQHIFRLFDHGMTYRDAGTVLFYEQLYLLSDDRAFEMLTNMSDEAAVVVISELMGRHRREAVNSSLFYRDKKEYIGMMRKLGYKLEHVGDSLHMRHVANELHAGQDDLMTTLVFRSKNKKSPN